LPAQKLSATQTAPAYSIVGMYSEPPGAQFVRHVAILAEDTQLEFSRPAAVFHMGPPLVAGERSRKTPRAKRECPVHLLGSVPLDLEDNEGIEDWLAEVDKERMPENPFKRYIVKPHADWYRAPETGRRLYRRFSCAGFVLECYRYINVDLVCTDDSDVPDVDLATLVNAYPEMEREEVLARLGLTRNDLGIPGGGPWRIVLAGYVFHALDRVTEEDPRPAAYSPDSVADAHFPGQR